MADYLFLKDGRRADVTDGSVRVFPDGSVRMFPDGGVNFRDSVHVGEMERRGNGWMLTRNGHQVGVARSKKESVQLLLADAADDIAARQRAGRAELDRYNEAIAAVRQVLSSYEGPPELLGPVFLFTPDQALELLRQRKP